MPLLTDQQLCKPNSGYLYGIGLYVFMLNLRSLRWKGSHIYRTQPIIYALLSKAVGCQTDIDFPQLGHLTVALSSAAPIRLPKTVPIPSPTSVAGIAMGAPSIAPAIPNPEAKKYPAPPPPMVPTHFPAEFLLKLTFFLQEGHIISLALLIGEKPLCYI